MRATVNGIEVEGTPEEIARLYAAMTANSNETAASEERETPESNASDGDGLTEKFAYRALRRLPLSDAQKSLLTALKKASPGWLLSSELQIALNCSPTSLGGVLGGLGRRVSATKGHKAEYNLWDWKWDEDEGQYAYRLPDEVLSALERAGL
jgi:hypothetical protein